MKIILFIALAFLLQGCNSNASQKYEAKSSSITKLKTVASSEAEGKELLEKYCYSCHQVHGKGDRIAPPMVAVKNHYLDMGDTKEDFTEAILAWVENPSEERSRMPGALRKFGVMPYQPFPKDTIIKIAHYLYDNEIEKPHGFRSYQKGKKGKRHGKAHSDH